MLETVLSETQKELVRQVRAALAEAAEILAASDAREDDRRSLGQSIGQLDELFLLVVVGEFNAGKSALINSILGGELLTEGVTPTTSKIQLITWGEQPSRSTLGPAIDRVSFPAPLLREVDIVDTPGTNALNREHEAITARFVPRSDLVLFVTSADRPFSESERMFLEGIRNWGKKILFIINKKDILEGPLQVQEVAEYVTTQAQRMLGITPHVFPVSARWARGARTAGDEDALEGSGLPAIERYLRDTLDETERLRLKLLNPIGVATSLVGGLLDDVTGQLELLKEDFTALDDIERQLEAYRADIDREFKLRLADIDNVLHQMEVRGLEFFDETIRLGRLPDLVRKERIRSQFERMVIADAPQEIERKVESIIDWLVESDIRQWQAVVEHVNLRRSRHADRIVGHVGARFESDRTRLLETVGRAAREGMEGYDRETEASRMAADVQQAVAGTALVEAGAVGLGATVALIASSTVADVTGLLAAGVMATLGLFIIPAKRARAKKNLRERIGATRTELMGAITEQFHREADSSLARIRETIAPYTRFVRSEREHLEKRRERLQDIAARLTALEQRTRSL
ncbi:MAG: dynamin [Acidobacteria bacterium]|nr:dynamin [Acidobacteriota bacterium]